MAARLITIARQKTTICIFSRLSIRWLCTSDNQFFQGQNANNSMHPRSVCEVEQRRKELAEQLNKLLPKSKVEDIMKRIELFRLTNTKKSIDFLLDDFYKLSRGSVAVLEILLQEIIVSNPELNDINIQDTLNRFKIETSEVKDSHQSAEEDEEEESDGDLKKEQLSERDHQLQEQKKAKALYGDAGVEILLSIPINRLYLECAVCCHSLGQAGPLQVMHIGQPVLNLSKQSTTTELHYVGVNNAFLRQFVAEFGICPQCKTTLALVIKTLGTQGERRRLVAANTEKLLVTGIFQKKDLVPAAQFLLDSVKCRVLNTSKSLDEDNTQYSFVRNTSIITKHLLISAILDNRGIAKEILGSFEGAEVHEPTLLDINAYFDSNRKGGSLNRLFGVKYIEEALSAPALQDPLADLTKSMDTDKELDFMSPIYFYNLNSVQKKKPKRN